MNEESERVLLHVSGLLRRASQEGTPTEESVRLKAEAALISKTFNDRARRLSENF